MNSALGHHAPSRYKRMANAGYSHPGLTAMAVGAVNRTIPPLMVSLALWACMAAYGVSLDQPYRILMLVSILLSILLFRQNGVWEPFARQNPWATLATISSTWLLLFGILLMIGYATKSSEIYSRKVLLTWFLVTPPALIIARLGIGRLLLPIVVSTERSRRVVIAGVNDLSKSLAERIRQDVQTGMDVVGFFEDRNPDRLGELPTGRILGKLSGLPDYVKQNDVDVIFIALPIRNVQRVSRLLDQLYDTTVSIYFIPDIFVFDLIQCRTTDIGGLPAIALCETPFYGPSGLVKRISDIVIASIALVLISPLLAAIALAVGLTSKGSIIFRQRRYGLDGREITVYKFRTMRVSEDGSNVAQASRNDPRVTPVGRFLRRYSLDELPQFVNVLQGRMSIVGPRPHAVAHNEEYRGLIKGYMLRHKVRPGITGLAQVNGFRGETRDLEDMQRRVEYDLDYLRNWSLGLDLAIIFRTLGVVLSGHQAY